VNDYDVGLFHEHVMTCKIPVTTSKYLFINPVITTQIEHTSTQLPLTKFLYKYFSFPRDIEENILGCFFFTETQCRG